jgi:hypothetical protein
VALRGDNAGPHTLENARRKAYTASSFRQSTTDYAKKFADNDPVVRQQVTLPNVIAIPGGLPIKVGNDVIGGARLRDARGRRALRSGPPRQGRRPAQIGGHAGASGSRAALPTVALAHLNATNPAASSSAGR